MLIFRVRSLVCRVRGCSRALSPNSVPPTLNVGEAMQNPYYGGDDPTSGQTNVTSVENPYYGGDDPTDIGNNVVVVENPYYGGDDPTEILKSVVVVENPYYA